MSFQPNIFDSVASESAKVAQQPILRDTRRKAHDKIKPSVRELQMRLIKAFYFGAWNADAWAGANGLSILSVRPRVTELKKAGLLHRIGYGLTQDGNEQDKFTLYPLYRDRMAVLIEKFGIDKAAEHVADWIARK